MLKNIYSQLPNSLVYVNTKENRKSMAREFNNKIVLIVLGISQLNNCHRNTSSFTLDGLLRTIGLNVTKENIKMAKESLDLLHKNKLIESNIEDFKSIDKNTWIVVNPMFFKTDSDGNKIEYFQLFDKDFINIMNCDEDIQVKYGLVLLFSFYSATCHKGNDIGMSREGKPMVSFHSYDSITENTGLSPKSILEYLKILEKLNLIKYDSAGDYTKKINGKSHYYSSPQVVALASLGVECEDEIKFAINQFKHIKVAEGWTFLNKEGKDISDKRRSLANSIKRQNQLKSNDPNDWTDDKEEKLNETIKAYDSLKEIKLDRLCDIQSVNLYLRENPNQLLSEAYKKDNRMRMSNRMLKIEKDLCLTDENNNLLLDFEGYKWAIRTHFNPDYNIKKLTNGIIKKKKDYKDGKRVKTVILEEDDFDYTMFDLDNLNDSDDFDSDDYIYQ